MTTNEVYADFFASGNRFVIFTHIAPDGDAMGSSLALWHWLRGNDKQATIIVPNQFPPFLAWLPGAEYILVYETQTAEAEAVMQQADRFICADFNEPKRIGVVGERLLQFDCPKLLIDHHLNPSDFATVTISNPAASSTCELVYKLLSTLDSRLSTEIAVCLYTGLMTDTGNFAFNSNNPELYEIIAALMRAGIDKDAIYDHVFNQYSVDRMRLMGYCLYRKMRVFPEYHLALITLSDEELQQFHFQQGDAEGIVNLPLQVTDIYYSVLMREQAAKPGTPSSIIKISFRSQGDRPVNIMAHEVFRGGGHKNASGGDFYGTVAAATRVFLREYPKYFKKD